MVTARGEDFERIMGLDIGADDYIVKPFSPGEVMARIRAILRRLDQTPDNQDHHKLYVHEKSGDPIGRIHRKGRWAPSPSHEKRDRVALDFGYEQEQGFQPRQFIGQRLGIRLFRR